MARKPKQTETQQPAPQTQEKKMAGFEDILNKRIDNVEKPKPRPAGTYIGAVTKPAEITKIGKNETLAAIVRVKLLSPGPDVDQSDLAASGGIGDRELRTTWFLTEDALWRLKDFLNKLGLDTEGSETIGQLLAQITGRQAMFKIKHRPSPDGSELYEELDSVASL